jgi:hypothetical protein
MVRNENLGDRILGIPGGNASVRTGAPLIRDGIGCCRGRWSYAKALFGFTQRRQGAKEGQKVHISRFSSLRLGAFA